MLVFGRRGTTFGLLAPDGAGDGFAALLPPAVRTEAGETLPLAAAADGETRIINAGRLRLKESDRLGGTARLLRALGDSKTPLYFLILSSFLNIVLDLFLIVVVKLGTAGAAYATIIAQGVSALLCFIYMFRKKNISYQHQDFTKAETWRSLRIRHGAAYIKKELIFHIVSTPRWE